jgi:CubicO group peptidase (beta-lactamase class C family)
MKNTENVKKPNKLSSCILIAAILGGGSIWAFGGLLSGFRIPEKEYPKVAPFSGVHWENDTPIVEVEKGWYTLVSLDGIAAGEIVSFCKQTYPDKWQMRFGEDLVEVLDGMGHELNGSVTLVVLPPGSSTPKTLDNVAMTEANRSSVRSARSAVSIDTPKVPLKNLVASLREEKKLVGLAAMVVVDGRIVDSAVDGERKAGSGVPLEIGDRWHLGSITKSITATMIARLVESGKMRWTDTIGACFPDAAIHEDWKPVTLRQLLTHTSGARANFPISVAMQRPELGTECTTARREAVLNVLAEKPENAPGAKHLYSNVGFTIAGAMAETATGETWDNLVKREVFEPLQLTGAGFGPPKSSDKNLEQPRGHQKPLGWKMATEDTADNTAIIAPAGLVHMTLADLCAYATEHLRGEQGNGKLLSAETYKLLHTPELDDYACGWVKNDGKAGIRHTVFWHNGSNTMWYALVTFIPATNVVVAVTSNDCDIAGAQSAAWEIVANSAKQDGTEQLEAAGPAVPIDNTESFRSRVDDFLKTAQIKAGFSGTVIIARGGQPIYQGAFGFSHLESKALNTLDTPFRIASLSKQFTAAAIFCLEGQGKLNIDDPVHKYLTEFSKAPYRDITIHHLLTHTSGLPRTPEGLTHSARWNNMSRAETPVDDYVRLAVEMPLKFDPGTKYEYSNFGYRVLAALIARVTGREYADFMEQELFQPLGMKNSGVARVTRPESESRVAEGLTIQKLDPAGQHVYVNGEDGRNFGAGYGSGGIYTSANDLLKWDRVLAGDDFLNASQKARLFTPVHDNYACGWIVKKPGNGRETQSHSGANEGFFSQILRVPDDGLVIIAVGNVDDSPKIDEVLKFIFKFRDVLSYGKP